MGTIAHEQLAGLGLMKTASMEDLIRCAPLWHPLRVAADQVLWPRGQAAHELGVVLSGGFYLQVGDHQLKTLSQGAILGEEGAFFHGAVHSADVIAREDSLIATLPAHQIRALRETRSSVYEALVKVATLSVVRRVREASAAIAKAARHDTVAPSRQELSALVKAWRKLVPGGSGGDCPPLAPLLRRQPGIAHAPPEAVLALTASFTSKSVDEGEVIFLEGEQGDAMYLIGTGAVDVLRHVRGGAKRLVTLAAGGQFGCNALVEPGPRTASCVARKPSWLYRIDAEHFRNPPRQAGVTWWESVLHNLADQARRSDDNLLAALEMRHAPEPPTEAEADEGSLKALLDASGFRNEGDVHTSELAEVEVVYSSDQRRNWKADR
ncbi:MAG TPA: cyclic nucleotide-binding domain-containing protein [Myxococcota bacterium]|nr:cyclic nucleotide-binding domain-containing protein [Myxococcota bacterium]